MQLRVARLCLDCEELHNETSCPLCASQSYAFLVNWLPVEERRRWRRPRDVPQPASFWVDGPAAVVRAFGRWLSGEPQPLINIGPATRAADHASQLNFDKADDGRPNPQLDLEKPAKP